MYLSEAEIRKLLAALGELFPQLEIACDIATREFLARYARRLHAKILGLGASFALPARPLAELFAEAGFAERERISIPGRAAELGALPALERLAVRLLRSLREGYTIRVFGRTDAPKGAQFSSRS